jgi:D-alanyl-lipoteichoic acid acyltransferase DltB (MBOAT superfamily)
MLFHTPEFALFFAIVLPLYFLLPYKGQNLMLLIASYIFYGWWDWRCLSLLFLSTVIDFSSGLALVQPGWEKYRKAVIIGSVTFQHALLAVFKYYNFFAQSLAVATDSLGLPVALPVLEIVLPVGISFYTFHTISYTVDIYTGRYKNPTRDFIAFAVFVSFFPQLVAGPIARASHLLPQMLRPRTVHAEEFFAGGYYFMWGLFKKVFIADNLAVVVDRAFAHPADLDSAASLVAIYAFAFQIYCDFSGYTDMARGLSQFMGFELQPNFNLPYFSRNPSEFWTRWHISLSTLLRDYLYIPLGGNRFGTWNMYRNLMITMLLGGLWHGANWTYVAWGAYQGLLLVGYRILGSSEKPNTAESVKPLTLMERGSFLLQGLVFFHLVCVGWVLFRAATFNDALLVFQALTRTPVLSGSGLEKLVLIAPLLMVEVYQFVNQDDRAILKLSWPLRALFYIALYLGLISLGQWSGGSFIYFQF